MKIAIFHELTPLSGARKVVEEYGKILKEKNQVDLYYVDKVEDKSVSGFFNKVYFFKFSQKEWSGRNWRVRIYKDTLELIKLYALHKRIASIIKKNDYDLILINPSKFTQAPFLLRFIEKSVYFCEEPLRIIYDDLFKISENISIPKKLYEKTNRKIRKAIDGNNIHCAGIVLANSEFSKSNIREAYGIETEVCYLGVNTDKFKQLNLKKSQDILFVGDKSNVEGYDLLESTLKLYKEKPSVKYIVRNEHGKGITEKELINEFNKSKIALALSRNEPFGLLPLEAMACGVPVIAVSEGGLKESVLDDRTGYLISRDKVELKEKIDNLLNNDELRNKMGKTGRTHMLSKFTWKISVNHFLDIIENKGYSLN